MTRYLRLLWVQARASIAQSMQYRVDFVVSGVISLFMLTWHLIPLWIVFDARPLVAGWDFPSALVVIGIFTALRGLLDGAINPSLVDVVDRIRTGTMDYLLLKPADAQFLVSTARLNPWKLIDLLGGGAMVCYGLRELGHVPSAGQLGLTALLLAAAVLALYSLWIFIVAASFWAVRLDNLTFMFSAIFDAARWPVQVFRGVWRVLFTIVIPLALMTTYPAMALLGRLSARTAALSLLGALLLCVVARVTWLTAVGKYTSASS